MKVINGIAWAIAGVLIATIIFVRAPNSGDNSGGKQAGEIIKAGGGALSSVLTAITGGKS